MPTAVTGETRRVRKLRAEVTEAGLLEVEADDAPLRPDSPKVRTRRRAAYETARQHHLITGVTACRSGDLDRCEPQRRHPVTLLGKQRWVVEQTFALLQAFASCASAGKSAPTFTSAFLKTGLRTSGGGVSPHCVSSS